MAAVAWVCCEWIHHGKPTLYGAASGCVAGLVAITPAAGFVGALPSLWIGLFGGVICYVAVVVIKNKVGYDDSLDAFGLHGIGGTWGAIATGIWASTEVNEAGANGLFYGGVDLFVAQLLSVVVAYVFAIVGSYILFKVVSAVTEVRASETVEMDGMDVSEHGESAYNHSLFGSNSLPTSAVNKEIVALGAKSSH